LGGELRTKTFAESLSYISNKNGPGRTKTFAESLSYISNKNGPGRHVG
jgi:hypothetical protein